MNTYSFRVIRDNLFSAFLVTEHDTTTLTKTNQRANVDTDFIVNNYFQVSMSTMYMYSIEVAL